MSDAAEPRTEFRCTVAGAVAAGRRRLRLLLLGPALLMLLLAVTSWAGGRIFQGVLCVGVAIVLWFAWRMSAELEPLRLVLAGDRLEVELRNDRLAVPLTGAAVRRLDADERRYLERLASVAGIVRSVGGFDSTRLGEFNLYAGDLESAVLLETDERRFVLTPDDADRFVEAVGRIATS